ncbi:MAG TPA: glycosyltransferase [Thermoanaerobaculia bacterium]|nr:glycosyltransferase [Thermoanaerobaculia bacterium]
MKPLLALRLLRSEGPRALCDRASDRLAEARRRRSFRPAAAPPQGFAAAVLNLSATPPAPRLGGVQAQLLLRLDAEAERRPVALLYAEARAGSAPSVRGRADYRLELSAPGSPDLGRCALALPGAPPSAVALDDPAFEEAVGRAAGWARAAALHVEGLAGLPLGSLLRLRQSGLRLILALHDFSAFCPRPHLFEETVPRRFCCYSRDRERCRACLAATWPTLDAAFQERRRELSRQLLAAADALIFPSSFLAGAYGELFGGEGAARVRIQAPAGQAPHSLAAPPTAPPGRQLRHAAFVGSVQAHKGALVFADAVERLAAAGHRLRFTVYGGGEPAILARLRRLPGVRVRGYFRAGALPALLRADRVDLALLLSIVPESYGLTLDECAAAGVPAAAFDLGALGERLRATGGLLLPAGGGTAAVADLLADLLAGRAQLPAPPPAGAQLSAGAAAAACLDLYRELGLTLPGS